MAVDDDNQDIPEELPPLDTKEYSENTVFDGLTNDTAFATQQSEQQSDKTLVQQQSQQDNSYLFSSNDIGQDDVLEMLKNDSQHYLSYLQGMGYQGPKQSFIGKQQSQAVAVEEKEDKKMDEKKETFQQISKSNSELYQPSLFFSKMCSKLSDEIKKSDAEKEIMSFESESLITQMLDHWENEDKKRKISAIESRIIKVLRPLESLEQQWVVLRKEIEARQNKIGDIEQEIKDKTSTLKELLKKKNEAKKEE